VFNVGKHINLSNFDLDEIKILAKQYQLDEQLGEDGLRQLMQLTEGHPYLIQEAFANLKSQQITLRELLRLAPTDQGIYSDYLRDQLSTLQNNPQLESAYKKVVMTNEPVKLDNSEVKSKLHDMGLVKFHQNECLPSCDLFRQYFRDYLG
jgi:AAA-like domain